MEVEQFDANLPGWRRIQKWNATKRHDAVVHAQRAEILHGSHLSSNNRCLQSPKDTFREILWQAIVL